MDQHHIRPVRPPPTSRRALFHPSTRRQPPTSVVRPDTATIFQQPMEDELVERNEKGEYKVDAPNTSYKHLVAMSREADEETEQENQMIELYGKQNAHWDPAAVEEEIKGALKSSLKKKTASIEDDRWMFEGETDGLGKK
ncbi:hypothetical protein FB567DRAFT_525449 [Paraphoma chrysanthemicola]|uniref:Uncharacterized protein n=1 Tax=Paraphoma chrysanthemicola TaxID=798071 RepID=A0A8K0VYW9_9PLEO|nr:hypothetical protein FB567DRAFT_525449 [Paraphoma chrysanthemicola]